MPGGVEIHLPCWLNYKTLYGMMKDDLGKQKESALVSYSLFCSIMNTDFPDVKIPKVCDYFTYHIRKSLALGSPEYNNIITGAYKCMFEYQIYTRSVIC